MDWGILKKYIQGRCSERELRQLGTWLQEDPANEDFFKTFIEYWDREEHAEFEADAQAAWQCFKKNYSFPSRPEPADTDPAGNQEPAPLSHDQQVGVRGSSYWSYFAAVAVILVITLFFSTQNWMEFRTPGGKAELSAQKITTDKGQRTNLRLSDGSLVTLNAESRLEIPENYGEPSRTIYLEGEAFFEVEHDEDHPFVVITPRGYVKDLGTQFNVTAYDSSKIEVAVKEGLASLGKVQKGNLQEALAELIPGKLGVLRETGGITVTDITHMEEFTGWAEGKLVFRETPFPEVVQRLERWFNIEGMIEDPQLKERTLTATYSDMPVDEVLQVLSASLRVSYERDKRTIIFRDNNSRKE